MGENTKIEWSDHSVNFWLGCSKVHAGCTNCYAENQQADRLHNVTWGPSGTRKATKQITRDNKINDWNNESPRFHDDETVVRNSRVFVNSLSDFFEDWSGPILNHKGNRMFNENGSALFDPHGVTMNDLRKEAFQLFDSMDRLDFMLLTKRPENIRRMWYPADSEDCERGNVHLYYSASDQETLEQGIGHLLDCSHLSPVLGLSLEPLIGPIDLAKIPIGGASTENKFLNCLTGEEYYGFVEDGHSPFFGRRDEHINHVIVGGESGPNARPCRIEWIESIVEQCRRASIPCFVKQLGSNAELFVPNEGYCKYATNDPKGGNMLEWPDGLEVRELPA